MVPMTWCIHYKKKRGELRKVPTPLFFLRCETFKAKAADDVLLEKVTCVDGRRSHDGGAGVYLKNTDFHLVEESPLLNRVRVHLVRHDEGHHLHPPRFMFPVVLGTRNVQLEVPSIFLGMGDARSSHG